MICKAKVRNPSLAPAASLGASERDPATHERTFWAERRSPPSLAHRAITVPAPGESGWRHEGFAMLIFDAHLDLGLNGVDWNRNLDQDVADLRAQEKSLGMTDPGRGGATVSFPEL